MILDSHGGRIYQNVNAILVSVEIDGPLQGRGDCFTPEAQCAIQHLASLVDHPVIYIGVGDNITVKLSHIKQSGPTVELSHIKQSDPRLQILASMLTALQAIVARKMNLSAAVTSNRLCAFKRTMSRTLS